MNFPIFLESHIAAMFQSPPTRSFLRETNAFDDPHVKKPKLQYPAAIWHYKTASLVGISHLRMATLSWTHPVVRSRRCRGTWGPVAFFRCVGWSWTEICCRKPLGSFKLEHRSQLMNLGIFIYCILFNILFNIHDSNWNWHRVFKSQQNCWSLCHRCRNSANQGWWGVPW